MSKEITQSQVLELLLRIRELVNQYKAVRQMPEPTGKYRQDSCVRQREETLQMWETQVARLLTMTQDGDLSGVLDTLISDLDKISGAPK